MERNRECDWVRDRINAFIDNQLQTKEAVRMTDHLESCVPCRHEYDRLKAVSQSIRSLSSPSLETSARARERAMARFEQAMIQPEKNTGRSIGERFAFLRRLLSGPNLRPLAASLAVAAVGGVAFLLWPDEIVTETPPASSVSVPTSAEWDTLFHRHDAQSISFSADDPTLRRDTAAEAHASLLRQADEELTNSL